MFGVKNLLDSVSKTIDTVVNDLSIRLEYLDHLGVKAFDDLAAMGIVIKNELLNSNYMDRALVWSLECFGDLITYSVKNRNYVFLEEAFELVQSTGLTKYEALLILDSVYNRPKGEIDQEVGGVFLSLSLLCSAHGLDMEKLGITELTRVEGKIDEIRLKQTKKPINTTLIAP